MITMTNGSSADQGFKDRYNRLMQDTFGFSFDNWYRRNVWDDDYECYSIFENDVMISNVSVFKMKLLIDGNERLYLQFGAVATQKEHRGKGLSRQLMKHVFTRYPHTPSFLVANDSVLEFYPKFGYVSVNDKQPQLECRLENTTEAVKLDINDPKVDFYLKNRCRFSRVFDCLNQYSINWFHLIYSYSEDIYEIPQLGVMLVAQQYGSTLDIFDIVSVKEVEFSQLMPFLPFKGVETIRFGFNPDWLSVDCQMKYYKLEDATLFVKGHFNTESDYLLPFLIKT